MHRPTPYEAIVEKARTRRLLSEGLIELLPARWEFLGDIASLKLPPELVEHSRTVGALYADVLGVKTVIRDSGGIRGATRRPAVEIIHGSETETVHVENGIRYHMDVTRVMFASGNIDERIRTAGLDCSGENVLDMFAGIGYFTIPLAKYTSPRRVIACEINPEAVEFLRRNIGSNGVEGLVEVRQGDCRQVAPVDWAHRIFMGYLHDTHRFLPGALAALSPGGGSLHYHEVCPEELIARRPEELVTKAAGQAGYEMEAPRVRKVKSYAPGVWHVVLECRLVCPGGRGRV